VLSLGRLLALERGKLRLDVDEIAAAHGRPASHRVQAGPAPDFRGKASLTIEEGGLVVRYADREVRLTPTERRVLVALARRPGRPAPVGDLGRAGWAPGAPTDFAYVRTVISQLRRKLNSAAAAAGPAAAGLPEDVIETRKGRFDDATTYSLALGAHQVVLPDSTSEASHASHR